MNKEPMRQEMKRKQMGKWVRGEIGKEHTLQMKKNDREKGVKGQKQKNMQCKEEKKKRRRRAIYIIEESIHINTREKDAVQHGENQSEQIRKQIYSQQHTTSPSPSQTQPLMMRNLLIRILLTRPLSHGLIKRRPQFTESILKRIQTSITTRMRKHFRWTVHGSPVLLQGSREWECHGRMVVGILGSRDGRVWYWVY